MPGLGGDVVSGVEQWGSPYSVPHESSPPRLGYSGENGKLFKIGTWLIVISLLLLALSLFLPWYFWDVEHEYDDDRKFEARLELDFEGEHWVEESKDLFGEEHKIDQKVKWDDTEDDNLNNVYRIVEGGVIFAGILVFLSLIGAGIVGSTGARSSDGSRKALRWLTLLSALVLIVILGYMWNAHPTALEDDTGMSNYSADNDGPWKVFMGSDEYDFESGDGRMVHSWGPYIGYYLAGVAAILMLASLVVFHKAIDEDDFTMYIWKRDNPEASQALEDRSRASSSSFEEAPDKFHVPENREEPMCPTCGRPIRYIDEYTAWYCDNCQDYVG